MEIEPRPYAAILSDPYCPEDQAVGCESCTGREGEEGCEQRVHDTYKCWELELHGLDCEICKLVKLSDSKL